MNPHFSIVSCLLVGLSLAIENVPGRNTIVITLPDIANDYYKPFYKEIVDFMVSYEQSVENENFIILADKEGIKNIRDRVGKGRVLYGPILDIWMRDLTSTGRKPGGLALFNYEPNYIEKSLHKPIRDSFLKAMTFHGVSAPYDTKSDTIADGGNIVDNGVDWAIATERIYLDNKVTGDPEGKTKVVDDIAGGLQYENLLVIKEFPDDTLGHSDGYVSFIDDNSLAISSLGLNQTHIDDPSCWGDVGCEQVKAMIKEIQTGVEGSTIDAFVVPTNYQSVKWRTFNNACGAHVNSVVNDKYIYMPVFYDEASEFKHIHTKEFDDDIYARFKNRTRKTIVQVFVPNEICRMGGNIRCLAWQAPAAIADVLIAAANDASDSYFDDAALDALEENYYGTGQMPSAAGVAPKSNESTPDPMTDATTAGTV